MQGRTHFSASVCHTDITARITLLGELAGQKVIKFGLEDTVGDELALLADLTRHFEGVRLETREVECKPRGCHPEWLVRIQPIHRFRPFSAST